VQTDRGQAPDNALALKQLDQELRGIIATGQVPALALGVVYQGNTMLTRTLGVRTAGLKNAIDSNTRFRIASMSKTFSAALVGKLVDQGFLRWDTQVNLLVPSFYTKDPNSRFLSVEQLLSHRTGLKHHTLDDELEASSSFAPIRSLLPEQKSACAVGYCFAYQNMAYNVATDIVYAATGSNFEQMMQREIFEPLAMTRTNIGMDALMEDENWARPHERRQWRNVAVDVKPNYYWMPASAGVNASVSDMQQWLLALLGHRLEAMPSTVASYLTTPQVATPGETLGPKWRTTRLRSASYGLGMRVFDYHGHTVWFHAGALSGYRGMTVLLPEKDVAFVLMWNGESNLPAGLVPTLLDRWLGLKRVDWLELTRYQRKAPVPRALRRYRRN
jgi:beta-lactamase class C